MYDDDDDNMGNHPKQNLNPSKCEKCDIYDPPKMRHNRKFPLYCSTYNFTIPSAPADPATSSSPHATANTPSSPR